MSIINSNIARVATVRFTAIMEASASSIIIHHEYNSSSSHSPPLHLGQWRQRGSKHARTETQIQIHLRTRSRYASGLGCDWEQVAVLLEHGERVLPRPGAPQLPHDWEEDLCMHKGSESGKVYPVNPRARTPALPPLVRTHSNFQAAG